MLVDKLPEGITMRLYMCPDGKASLPGKVLFSSSKKWLHPLFELEEFLAAHEKGGGKDCRTFEFHGGLCASSSDLFLRDRVIGRAAAFLIARIGIRRVETDILSRLALPLFKANSVSVETIDIVDAISCVTEDLLKDISNHEGIYTILSERRARALSRMNA